MQSYVKPKNPFQAVDSNEIRVAVQGVVRSLDCKRKHAYMCIHDYSTRTRCTNLLHTKFWSSGLCTNSEILDRIIRFLENSVCTQVDHTTHLYVSLPMCQRDICACFVYLKANSNIMTSYLIKWCNLPFYLNIVRPWVLIWLRWSWI